MSIPLNCRSISLEITLITATGASRWMMVFIIDCCENHVPPFDSTNGDWVGHTEVNPLQHRQKQQIFLKYSFYHVCGKRFYELLLVHRPRREKTSPEEVEKSGQVELRWKLWTLFVSIHHGNKKWKCTIPFPAQTVLHDRLILSVVSVKQPYDQVMKIICCAGIVPYSLSFSRSTAHILTGCWRQTIIKKNQIQDLSSGSHQCQNP